MFVNAVEKVGGYTRPIFTIARRYDSIDVLPGASNLFFINDEGWALTTRATARLIIKSGKIEENYSKFRADRKARENDENFQDELRLLETKYGMGGKSFAQLKVNFFDCVDNLTGFECKLSKNHELAAIHMMGYNNLTYVGHAVFAEDARRAMPGKYLCRLGYPFPEFRNYSYDPEKDDIVWTDAGHRFTSRFPADGMLTRLMADGRGKVFGIENADLDAKPAELGGQTLGEALLTPTRIYVKPVMALLKAADVKGISHITGGGFYENVPRSVPDGLCAEIDKAAVKVPAIFGLLQKRGNIPERDMFNTYNMGVGMAVIVAAADADKALEVLKASGEDAYVIGRIIKGEDKIVIK